MCTVRVPLTTFRQSDAIGRLGGDEFVAMLTDSNKYTVGEMLARFAVAVDKVNAHIKKPYKIQYSVGQEHVPHDTKKSAEEMIQEADAAMYQHKENKDR